ncbi:MAG: TM0996/MTH895 family glutaredoxin-like protein [Chloroflexota bacterium]|nr:MAG: TM0996/MTH895 family glutaredoxin-like protein [Chloroflexota bacterium]
MNIKILGTGCSKCHALQKTTKEVVQELGINATVEEVKDINKIVSYNVLMTPGLVINENVVSSGKVPSKAEVTQLIVNALAQEEQPQDS